MDLIQFLKDLEEEKTSIKPQEGLEEDSVDFQFQVSRQKTAETILLQI
jgi:hypothetical protein